MQVVILAGGLGTRLRPITEQVPKPMVPVGGTPFLEYIVRWLADQHFERLLLLLGYLGEQVQQYFGDGSHYGLRIDYGREPRPLGTGGALRNSYDKLEEQFLLLYGDSFLPIDYQAVVKEFCRIPSKGLVVVYDNAHEGTGVLNNVAADKTGRVFRYEKGTGAADLNYVEAGALCLRREIFGSLQPGQVVSLEEQIYPALIAEHQLRAFVTTQRFYDIGTPDRLRDFAATR